MSSRTTPRRHGLNPVATARLFSKLTSLRPTLGLVLGSGFGHATEGLELETEIPYSKLPGFPQPSVGGHCGKVLLGRLGDTPVLILSGRSHYYEGHSMEQVTFPMRALAEFGIRDVLLTNAAGGINRKFRAGDFMCLADHINLMGANPLRGELAPNRERFIDLSRAYDARLTSLVRRAAKKVNVKLYSGVYLAVSGPSYETPAEIHAFGRLGADAVGMSTVPEVIVGRQCGMRMAGLSCITNLAAGKGNALLSHADVLAAGERARQKAAALVERFVRLYAAKERKPAAHRSE